ncbi:hypothetical protein Tco_0850498 [Tanacetum coccineum]
MLWGIITRTNVDYAKLMWEEFLQTIDTFLTDKANLGSPTKKGRKDKPHVIPYCRFTKLIICHLGRIHNVHQRSASPFQLAEKDLRLGNLKFFPKGEKDEVFGMAIPNELITNNIRNAPYYNAYLEMVAKHDQMVAAQKEGMKKSASTKQSKPKPAIKKSSKPEPAPKPKVTKEKYSKASTAKPPKPKPAKEKSTKASTTGKGKVVKVHNLKNTFQLVDEHDEEPAHSEPEPKQKGAGEEHDMERAIQMSLESFQGQGHAHIGDELGEDVTKQANLKENTIELDQDQAGSDPDESLESRPQAEQVHMDEDQAGPDNGISHVALIGSDPEPTYDKFMTDLYPKVQESLKFPADEHINSILNDKATDEEPEKLNVDLEAVSMVTVPIYQASTSVPSITTEFELVDCVAALEKKLSDLEQNNKNLDNITRNLGSRVFTLELRDLPHKTDEAVCKNVKEVVQISLQAPLREHFRDLPEEDMKEMLHQRMFESGSYKSLPEHIALYEALEASMTRAQRDEFLTEKDKSRKQRRDDQDPLPPPDSDLSKRRRHDTSASGSSQPPAP